MLILIEFNELSSALIGRFIAQGKLPNFQRFYQTSTIFTTFARDEQLNPWVQWPTVHSGVPAALHEIEHMGDGSTNLRYKCVGDVLSDAGIRTGIFGSMNLNYGALDGYVIPDPWDKRCRAFPDSLTPFFAAVAQQVQDNSLYRVSGLHAAAFLFFLLAHGLTLGTAIALVAQLAKERLDKGIRWRRAMLLDRLSYDVFRYLNAKYRVEFATFFSNSTAHFQHYFWEDMDPSAFGRTTAPAHPSLPDAILDGYRAMDVLLHRFMSDYPDATLVLCTALSQGPREIRKARCNFHVTDPVAYRRFLGLDERYRITAMMSDECHIDCPDPESAARTAAMIEAVTVDDKPAHSVSLEGAKVVLWVPASNDPDIVSRMVRHPNGATARFGTFFNVLEGSASGKHRREGSLWVRNGEHRVVEEPVELTDIAPTILGHFRVAAPAYMQGRDLLGVPVPKRTVAAAAQ
jgi:hypothetical protein